ncbi:hypothetical protein ACHAPU_010808 [Fusarium lateritium]
MLRPALIITGAISAYYIYQPLTSLFTSTSLPSHLAVSPDADINLRQNICIAYQALFLLDDRHHESPPLFYNLLEIPANTDERVILKALIRVTLKHYETLDVTAPESGAYQSAQKSVDAWNRVGAVLLDPQTRAAYDRAFLKKRKWSVKDVLMEDDMCGGRWRRGVDGWN